MTKNYQLKLAPLYENGANVKWKVGIKNNKRIFL
jgi:hypothetical protein